MKLKKLALVLFIFIAAALVAYRFTQKKEKTVVPLPSPSAQAASDQSPVPHYRGLIDAYAMRHDLHKDRFWLTGEVDHDNPGPHVTKVNEWSKRVVLQLERFSSVNELAGRIIGNFQNFRTSMAVVGVNGGESSMQILMGKQVSQNLKEDLSKRLEVCAVPQNLWHRDRYPSPVFYFGEWEAVKVAGIEMPSIYETALIFHEMGHALRDRVDHAASAHAPDDSDLWISEEVEMHQLESLVLDKGSNGAFFGLYGKILGRTKSGDINELLKAVTEDDLIEYDRIFKIEAAGPTMASIYLAQFFLGLGFYTLDETGRDRSSKEREIAKIAYYRFIRQI